MEKGEDEQSNNSDMIPCDSDDMDKEDENDSKSHDDSDEEYQLKPKSTFIHLSLILERNAKGKFFLYINLYIYKVLLYGTIVFLLYLFFLILI